MARRVFPAGTVTNTTGAPLRLTFHVTSTTGRRETDLWTVDGSNNLVERIPNGVILTNSSGAYSAFAGPDDIDTLYLQPHTGAARTSILATARVASGVTEDNATYVPIGGRAAAPGGTGAQYLFYADHLRRWRATLADAANKQCHIGVYGDSITWGAYANNIAATIDEALFRSSGYVAQLRNLFANRYGTVGEGYLTTLVGTGTGGYQALAGGAFLGGPSRAGIAGVRAFINGTGQSATFTLPASTTVEIVYYWKQGQSAAYTYTMDGGSSTGGPTQTSDGTYRHTITGLSNTTHTLVITGSASGFVELIAVGAFVQTASGVAVHRYGKSGTVLADHFSVADPGTSVTSADQIVQIAGATTGLRTDLAVIALSANNPTTAKALTPTQVQAGFQTVCNTIVAQGKSVLLIGGPPVNPAGSLNGTTYHQSDYDAGMKAVAAATDHVAFLDLGAFWQSWAYANGLSFYTDAIAHPSRAGHGDIAQVVYDALVRPW